MQCVCGVTNPEGANFCSACGRRLEAPVAQPAESKPTPIPPPLSHDPKRAQEPVAGVGGWELNWAWRPIPHMAAAQAMSRVGAVACAIVAVVMAVVGVMVMHDSSVLGLGQFVFAAVYAACAFGLWRGAPIAGFVAIPLYLFNVLAALPRFAAAGVGGPEHPLGSTGVVFALVTYVAGPLALVCGVRGAMAWSRFRRTLAA
jgi:hypothetical protein